MKKNVFECDRCGTQVNVDHSTVPRGWSTVAITPKVPVLDLTAAFKAAFNSEPKDICETCTGLLSAWMKAGKRPPADVAQSMRRPQGERPQPPGYPMPPANGPRLPDADDEPNGPRTY